MSFGEPGGIGNRVVSGCCCICFVGMSTLTIWHFNALSAAFVPTLGAVGAPLLVIGAGVGAAALAVFAATLACSPAKENI